MYAIQSVEVALEGTPGNIASASKTPSYGSSTWTALPARRANLVSGLKKRGVPRDLMRSGPGGFPPAVPGLKNTTGAELWSAADGDKIPMWFGRIKLDLELETIGDGSVFSTYDEHPLVQVLLSVMGRMLPEAATDTVAATGSVSSFEATDASKYKVGQGFAVVLNNAVEHHIVTGKTGSAVTYSPASSTTLQVGQRIRHCYTLYPKLGTAPATIALRFVHGTRRFYAALCRLAEMSFAWEGEGESRALMVSVTVEPTVILRNDTGAAVADWLRPGGAIAQWLQAYHIMSGEAVSAMGTPAAATRSALLLHSWEATWRWGLASAGGAPEAITGRSNTEITSCALAVKIESEPNANLEAMFEREEQRFFAFGCGPGGRGSSLDAQGVALIVPSGSFTEGQGFDEVQERYRVSGTLQSGLWSHDAASDDAGNTSWRILLPL